MKFHSVLILLAACFLGCSLCACSSAERSIEIRNPLRLNSRAPSVAGPDYMQVPATYAPTYVPTAQPAPAAYCPPRMVPAPAAAPGCSP